MDPKCQLKLIDFGLATSYVTSQSLYKEPKDLSHHIEQTREDFQGNFAFCSPNSLLGLSTSRRDDLFSILYIILYLSTNKIPYLEEIPKTLSKIRQREQYKQKKIKSEPVDTCVSMNCAFLIDFSREVYNLSFNEKPNY
jgi:serine/threonine protein kinase